MKGEEICIVGNAPDLIGSGLGPTIDAFPRVMRFNNFKLEGYEADVGSKTTDWCLANNANQYHRPEVKARLWRTNRPQWYDQLVRIAGDVMVPIEIAREGELAVRINPNRQHLSSGLAVLFYFWKEGAAITFTGLGGTVGDHYYDKTNFPGSTWHDMIKERAWLSKMVREGELVEL